MAKGQKEIPGGIMKIKFDDKLHSYGRILRYGDIAFYDLATEADVNDLGVIIKSPIIFKGIVDVGGVQHGRWPIIGVLPLEEELQNTKYYLEEIGRPIMCKIIENGQIRYRVPKEECIGLEIGVIWSPEGAEERLRDHYAGRENIQLKMSDVLENYKLKR
jgi:hypothetical protein